VAHSRAVFSIDFNNHQRLGARLFLSGQVLETGQVFAILLLLAFLGIALTKGQDLIDDALSRWRTD